ncbi:hypothetical protein [Bradyrhizobium sp. URHC0002]
MVPARAGLIPISRCAGAVQGGRAQRLADQREIEKEKQQAAEQQRRRQDQDRLSGNVHAGDLQRHRRQRLGPNAFGAEEQQAKSDQREVQRDRDRQQQQNRGVRDRAEHDPVQQR